MPEKAEERRQSAQRAAAAQTVKAELEESSVFPLSYALHLPWLELKVCKKRNFTLHAPPGAPHLIPAHLHDCKTREGDADGTGREDADDWASAGTELTGESEPPCSQSVTHLHQHSEVAPGLLSCGVIYQLYLFVCCSSRLT